MKPLLYIGICLSLVAIIFSAVVLAAFPLKYKKEINQAARTYDVDRRLVASVINAESSFRSNAVSNKGAVGLMQIMPATAEWAAQKMKIEFTQESLTDPEINVLIGTWYLNYLLNKFKDLKTALIAYNAGEGKVTTWLADDRFAVATNAGHSVLTSCPYPATNRYVEKVMNGMNFYRVRF